MSIVGDKECGEITNTLLINKRSVGALFSPSTFDGNPYSYKDQVGFGQGLKWPQSTFATDYGLLAIMSSHGIEIEQCKEHPFLLRFPFHLKKRVLYCPFLFLH